MSSAYHRADQLVVEVFDDLVFEVLELDFLEAEDEVDQEFAGCFEDFFVVDEVHVDEVHEVGDDLGEELHGVLHLHFLDLDAAQVDLDDRVLFGALAERPHIGDDVGHRVDLRADHIEVGVQQAQEVCGVQHGLDVFALADDQVLEYLDELLCDGLLFLEQILHQSWLSRRLLFDQLLPAEVELANLLPVKLYVGCLDQTEHRLRLVRIFEGAHGLHGQLELLLSYVCQAVDHFHLVSIRRRLLHELIDLCGLLAR